MHTVPPQNADGTKALHGHRTRLTPDLIERVADRVAHGVLPLHALRAEGIPTRTALDWWQIGRGDSPRYPHPLPRYVALAEAIERASSEFVANEVPTWTAEGAHWKLREKAVSAFEPAYRDQPTVTVQATPLQAITDHLREVRALIQAREGPPQLRIVEGSVRVLEESSDAHEG